jgi:3-oxoacyl-[acyl-carrier protein] reductase
MSTRRVALVTGGASGIGLGISAALAADGFDLAVCGRREEDSVAGSLEHLRSAGGEVFYVSADVGSLDDHRRLVDAIEARFGRLDVLVNNAGVAPATRMDVLETTPESYDRVMGINLRGPFFLTQAVANWMVRQAGEDAAYRGAIINITSISSTVASPNRGEYCISKAGLSMMSSLWAVRLAGHGIPVFEVRPGIIRSDMTSAVQAKYDQLIEDGLMLQARWGEPEDVGKAVAMLARGDLPYSTGQVVMVDGGLTVGRL